MSVSALEQRGVDGHGRWVGTYCSAVDQGQVALFHGGVIVGAMMMVMMMTMMGIGMVMD
jgi:hypothetical protein